MGITDLLTEELVVAALEARGSDEVIETLGMRVAAQHRDIEPDRLLDDAADVVGGRRHVAEHDGRGAPERDEDQHRRRDDDDLGP